MTEESFLTQSHLAKRWGISPHTLERWRWQGEGPRFVKIGGRVRYRIADVEAYEASNSMNCTAQNTQAPDTTLVGGAA